MKNIYRILMLAIVMTAFTAATVSTSYAQGDDDAATVQAAEKKALYDKYIQNYKGTIEQRKVAVEAAKQYIEKFGANAIDVKEVNYYKAALPALEKGIKDEEIKVGYKKISDRYDSNFNKNFDEVYAAGKDFLATNPDLLEVMVDLGSVGFDESRKPTPNTKYNADTINYAKQAIAKIEGGAKNAKGNYAGYYYTFGDGDTSTRDNTLGNLNYQIAYLMYFNQNQKKEALPYFYKAGKYDSSVKNQPIIYQAIGESYYAEVLRLNNEAEALYKEADAMRKAGDKDSEALKAKEAEAKSREALAKGYAERTIDAYARAHKAATANPNIKKEYKDNLYKEMQKLYRFRFDDKIEGFDSYISTTAGKPFVEPSTTVTPVIIEATSTPTSTSSLSTPSSMNASDASSGSGASTAKTGGSAAKTTTATTAAKTPATTKAKTPAKKPAPKKKGTR